MITIDYVKLIVFKNKSVKSLDLATVMQFRDHMRSGKVFEKAANFMFMERVGTLIEHLQLEA